MGTVDVVIQPRHVFAMADGDGGGDLRVTSSGGINGLPCSRAQAHARWWYALLGHLLYTRRYATVHATVGHHLAPSSGRAGPIDGEHRELAAGDGARRACAR
jgi:hypothetical protein